MRARLINIYENLYKTKYTDKDVKIINDNHLFINDKIIIVLFSLNYYKLYELKKEFYNGETFYLSYLNNKKYNIIKRFDFKTIIINNINNIIIEKFFISNNLKSKYIIDKYSNYRISQYTFYKHIYFIYIYINYKTTNTWLKYNYNHLNIIFI